MTAITLNLLIEEQRAQEARAHDPIKTCIAVGISLISMTAVIGSVCSLMAGSRQAQEQLLQSQYDSLSSQRAHSAAAGFKATKGLADDLISLNQSRVMLAPQLALTKDVVPDTIELTRLDLKIVTEIGPPPSGGENLGETKRTPPSNVEHLTFRLEGRATCPRPELAVDTFVATLSAGEKTQRTIQKAQLRSIARVPLREFETPSKEAAAVFVIDGFFGAP